jgi:uncharacterized membrane protein YecN with MAPEG domain
MPVFTAPKLSLIYVGLMAFFYLGLTIWVIRWRWSEKRGLGHADDPKSPLFRAVRVHGNFAEFVPLLLLLLVLDEMTGRIPWMVHVFGSALIIGRVFHFFGVRRSDGATWQRAVGVVLTSFLLVSLGGSLLIKGLS